MTLSRTEASSVLLLIHSCLPSTSLCLCPTLVGCAVFPPASRLVGWDGWTMWLIATPTAKQGREKTWPRGWVNLKCQDCKTPAVGRRCQCSQDVCWQTSRPGPLLTGAQQPCPAGSLKDNSSESNRHPEGLRAVETGWFFCWGLRVQCWLTSTLACGSLPCLCQDPAWPACTPEAGAPAAWLCPLTYLSVRLLEASGRCGLPQRPRWDIGRCTWL